MGNFTPMQQTNINVASQLPVTFFLVFYKVTHIIIIGPKRKGLETRQASNFAATTYTKHY